MFIFPHGTWKDNIRSVILDWRQTLAGLLSRPVSSHVCVLWLSHYFTKSVPATEERYVRTISDCIPTSHKRRCRRIKIKIAFLYIYEFFVVRPAVRYAIVGLTSFSKLFLHTLSYYGFHIKPKLMSVKTNEFTCYIKVCFTICNHYATLNRYKENLRKFSVSQTNIPTEFKAI